MAPKAIQAIPLEAQCVSNALEQATVKPDRVQWIVELKGYPADFIPLKFETRTHVTTAVMCCHLGRKEQTARVWACLENGPLRPIRVNGRLAWPVAEIRRLLGVSV